MNCRQTAKIMPELAAGELDHTIEQEALLHINECPQCAAELVKYQEVLNAMSEPWKTLEAPADLYLPIYNVSRRPIVKRLCLAVAAVVVVLAVIIALPKHRDLQNHKIETTANVKPDKVLVKSLKNTVVEDQAVPPKKQTVAIKQVEHKVAVQDPKRISTVASNKHRNVIPEKKQQAVKQHVNTATAGAISPQPAPVIVVASQSPEPPIIKMESVDHATGEVCITKVVYNHSGDNLESEVRYTPNDQQNWRDEL